MNRRYLWLIGCLAVFTALADGPTDTLRAEWRNPVRTPSANGGVNQNGVMIGPGSGRYFTTNHTYYSVTGGYWFPTTLSTLESYIKNNMKVYNLRSTIGAPIAAVSANRFLGEPLDPPANWNGAEPTITEGTGGRAVWIDFAGVAITLRRDRSRSNGSLKTVRRKPKPSWSPPRRRSGPCVSIGPTSAPTPPGPTLQTVAECRSDGPVRLELQGPPLRDRPDPHLERRQRLRR